MKRTSSIATLAFVTVALTAAILLVAPPASQSLGFCSGYHYTPQNWGVGATCDEAYWDLYNRASADVDCGEDIGGPIPVCSTELIAGACWFNTMKGMYQRDGYIRYTCQTCGYAGGPDC